LWCNVGFAEEKCETSNPEIIIDLGGDSKPEKNCLYERYYL